MIYVHVLINGIEFRSIIYMYIYIILFQKHNEYDIALSKYKMAAQLIPESSALWNNVGMCFYGKQKFVAVSNTIIYLFIKESIVK